MYQVLSLGNYPEDRQSSVLCRDIIFEEASGISFRPALGLAWSHCVDTRLVLLNRSPGPGVADSTNVADVNLSSRYLPTSSTIVGDSVRSGPSTERVICVDKSPARARLHAVYAITAEGITVGPATAST